MINYPDLPLPLEGKQKTQATTFRTTQPLSGPAYLQKTSTDAPVFYDLTFTFSESRAQIFLAWVIVNKIHEGVEFNMPLRNEFTGVGGNATQIVRLIEGDIRSASNDGLGNYTYTGKFRCRKETTGMEEYYELIAEGGQYLMDGREIFDVAMNQSAPEG